MNASTWRMLLNVLAVILGPLFKAITPTIKEALEDGLDKLWVAAQKTDNPLDDFFVGFLFDILGLDRPE